jgi:hypothetical protein
MIGPNRPDQVGLREDHMKHPDRLHRLAIEAAARGRITNDLRTGLEEAFPGAIARASERREREAFDARFAGPVPAWAKRYVAKYWPGITQMRWRRSATTLHGTCDRWEGTIVVTARNGEPEQRLRILVLHEIAHRVGRGHDERYTAELRRLLVAEGLYRAALKSGLTGQSKLRRVKAATSASR